MDQQWRAFCFTWNNPPESGSELTKRLGETPGVRFVVMQLERGEEGTLHLQGYVSFNNSWRFHRIRELVPGAHIEAARGTAKQNYDYCTKEETREGGPWEHGEPLAPGKRTDLEEIATTVREEGIAAAIDKHPGGYIHFGRGMRDYAATLMKVKPRRPCEVTLLVGETGSGKTQYVLGKHPDAYIVEPGTSWFDGYEGEDTVCLDDFVGAASRWDLTSILRLLDRYRCRLNVKGSHSWLHATRIYVTTNLHPYCWYSWKGRGAQYWALLRRFNHIAFIESGSYHRLEGDDLRRFYGDERGPIPGTRYGHWSIEASEHETYPLPSIPDCLTARFE